MSTTVDGPGRRNRVLALVDGSVYSESVCDHAAWFAVRADAEVELLHLLSRRELGNEPSNLSGSIGLGARSALLEELTELDAQTARLGQQRGRAILVDAEARLHRSGVDRVITKLRHGEVVATVQELEDEADLIVLGKRGEAADFDRLHLGSKLERIVRSTSKPTLVASRAFKAPKRFLIAYDAGRSASQAVDFIADRPHYNDLECHLLSVGPANTDRQRQLEGAAATLRNAGYTVVAEQVDGQPDRAIAAEVDKRAIDLLVMGAYGHSRIRNLIIGSTTTEMIRSCMRPVLLFR